MLTLYWCPYQVLKATGAPVMVQKTLLNNKVFFLSFEHLKQLLCNILLKDCRFRIKSLRLDLISMLFEINNIHCCYLQVFVFSPIISEWHSQFWFTVLYRAGQNTVPVTLPLKAKKI